MAIGEGQFSKIGTTTSIYVEKKSGENGSFLEGVTMHMKKGEFGTVTTVIKAKKGVLKKTMSGIVSIVVPEQQQSLLILIILMRDNRGRYISVFFHILL